MPKLIREKDGKEFSSVEDVDEEIMKKEGVTKKDAVQKRVKESFRITS